MKENTTDTDTDTDIIIPQSIYVNKNYDKRLPIYVYIFIGTIYIMEIFTTILGGINDTNTNGFIKKSSFKIQHWLIASGIYNMCGLILTYQFNLIKYKNIKWFILYEYIKVEWLFIGALTIFSNITIFNFILGYSAFYIVLNVVLVSYEMKKYCRILKANTLVK
jgi:hypothetical protein